MDGKLHYRGRDPVSGEMIEVEVADGRVTAVRPSPATESDIWLAPGLVDLQVNGYGGVDLNDAACDADAVERLVQMLAIRGTTTFLPTVITGSQQTMRARLRTIADARSGSARVAHAVPAIHLEGPNISPVDGYRGAHPLTDARPPSLLEFDELQHAADGLVRLVTLSPHWPDSVAYVKALRSRGIVVAIGHTHATGEQIEAAVHAGAQLSTHLGNGIAAELHRHANPLWPQLADDRLAATLIADGAHLPMDVLQVILRAKGIARTVLVSDAVALAGSAPGDYTSPIGGDVTVGRDGSIRMRDNGLLAGSGIVLKDAVARAAALPGSSLGDAVQMATANPANCLGLQRGVAVVGVAADLLRFRWSPGSSTLQIVDVLVQGKSVVMSQ